VGTKPLAPGPAIGSRPDAHSPMADPFPRRPKPNPAEPAENKPEAFPSNEALLHELRKHGAPPPPPRELPAISRRTRDYLLLSGIASAGILIAAYKLSGSADPGNAFRLALTAIAVVCGLLWFIFYGVMSRY
jgi:hypothetical protein